MLFTWLSAVMPVIASSAKIDLVIALVGVARGALHAELRRNAADYNRREPSAAQLQIKISPVERAPLPLQDHNVAGLAVKLGNQFAPIRRQRAK